MLMYGIISVLLIACFTFEVNGVPLEGRIINGTKSHEPWVAELVGDNDGVMAHGCGGTLVHPRWVVTAAHCLASISGELLAPLKDVKVLFGSAKALKGDIFEIDKAFIHDYMDTDDFVDNDIALLKLKTPVPAAITRPILLPKSTDEFGGQIGTALGWGVTNNGNVSPDLLQTDMYMGTRNECLRDEPKYHYEKKICTQPGQSRGTICSGDSGGPLAIRNDDDQFVFVGVTSYGDCNVIATFTKVAHYVDWILSYIENDGE